MTAPGHPDNTNGTTDGASSTAPTSGEPSRWAAPQHSRFAGRTAEEILGIAELAVDQLSKFNQPVPQPQAQPQANRFDLDLPDDEYLTGRQVKGILQQVANQPPPVDQQARNLAAQSVYAAAQIRWGEEFRRWKPEIDGEIRKLPVEYWTNDNLDVIVKMVRSNHIDELAAEKAQRLLNESHPTIRSGTGGSGGVPSTQRTLADQNLPDGWKQQAASAGITEATVLEFCQITGQTPEQYLASVEAYGKGAVIRG